MELNREEKRLLLHFQWKLGFNASESARKICEAYGDNVIGESTAREWFAKFRPGEESLKDKSRSVAQLKLTVSLFLKQSKRLHR
jgi:transposase